MCLNTDVKSCLRISCKPIIISFLPSVSTIRKASVIVFVVTLLSHNTHSNFKHSLVIKHPVDVHVVAGLHKKLLIQYS